MEKVVSKFRSQMRKGFLEYIILSIMREGETYGSDIIKILKQNNFDVVEGTIYPLLLRLKNDGIISYNRIESSSGHPRKYYKLTQEGEKLLNLIQPIRENFVQLEKAINKS